MKRFLCKLIVAIAIVGIGSGISNSLFAQEELTTRSKKAAELYSSAQHYYDLYNYNGAIQSLNMAIEKDPKFVEAYLFLSQVYQEIRDYENAILFGDKALQVNPGFFPGIRLSLGELKMWTGKYESALNDFQLFKQLPKLNPKRIALADSLIVRCMFAIAAMSQPVPFSPENMGESVNSQYDDYWPSISADEKTLVVTSNIPRDTLMPYSERNRQEDFFVSFMEGKQWQKRQSLGAPINTKVNEGAQSLTADGKAMYFTICTRQCNLYYSRKEGDSWGIPVMLPEPVNSQHSTKQPSISPDERTLYFASNRPGGKGGFDIWLSHRRDDNSWTDPVNLGDSINTRGNEFSPFMHFDNTTLYFASDGHLGMGGQDIFMAKRKSDIAWSKAKNLGYPINTYGTEDGLVVSANAKHAYFSSVRDGSQMRDVYVFDLPAAIKPIPVSYIKGTIVNDETGEPVAAKATLTDLAADSTLMAVVSDAVSGEFLVCIPSEKSYGFTVEHPNFLFYSDNFVVDKDYGVEKPFKREIRLSPIKVGNSVVLRNIFFALDSWELLPDSYSELDKLQNLLAQNPKIRIEIGGHTDNTGTVEHNAKLSENRAKSVVDYLLSKGVSPSRLKWRGFADSKPISDNSTPEGRANNRRTEFRVIE